jgi:aminoglycoside phosphotransferase (APT) family kinase protein
MSGTTAPVRSGEALDWARLEQYLQQEIGPLRGPPEIRQYTGGSSNLTYRLSYGDADLVLRRPPFGTKAKTAHSMAREYRILKALKPVFSTVPEALHYSADERIIGAEFYLMREVKGDVVKSQLPDRWGFTPGQTRRFCERFWMKLIELHQVDYRAAGLSEFGQPEGYVERQIFGWNKRYLRAMTADADEFADVRGWLESHLPQASARSAVLHGDYRIDNAIFDHENPGRIVAILDWEICALGDPLMDLGNALAYWVEATDPPLIQSMRMQPSDAPGMMTRREILDLYQQHTGVDTRNFSFYLIYGYWRLAVILQQIYYRYDHRETRDRRFQAYGKTVHALGEHCRKLMDG